MPAYTDILYKYPPEVSHRAFTGRDLLKWGELIASGFRNRVPADMVEVYFSGEPPLLFYSSLQASDQRDNRLMRQLVTKVIESGQPFRFPYFDRDVFDDVRYTDVLTLGRSVLVLPIEEHNNVVGAIALVSRVPDVFRDDVVPLLTVQANEASVVHRTLFREGNGFTQWVDAGFYFEQLPDPVCVVNDDCTIEHFNHAFKTFYESHTGSTAVTKAAAGSAHDAPDFFRLMGDDRETFRDHVNQALLNNGVTFQHNFLIGGREAVYRIRMLRVDESHVAIWFYDAALESGQPAFNASPDNAHGDVLAAVPYAIWEVNNASVVSFANPRFLALTGYDESDVLSRSFFELLHPSQFTQYFELLRNAFSNQLDDAAKQFTAKIKTKSDAYVNVNGTIGLANGAVWFFGSETTSHQPVFAVSVQGVADALPVGIAALDDMFTCRYLSAAAQRITGYNLPESQATAFPLLVFNDNTAQQTMDRLAALQPNDTFDGTFELREKSGNSRFVSLTATSVKDEFEKTFYLLVLHDVTVLHVESERWKEAAHTAQDAQHAEEQYLARMSHEIRTAMNGIVGLTNVLMQAGLPGEQQQILNLIKQSTDNLLVIINDILDLSKIKSGKLQVEKIPVSLRQLFENIYAITLPKIGQKEIQFTYRVDPAVPEYIEADPVRLNQIVLNLLSNAIKFTERGRVEYNVIATTNERGNRILKFTVADTGIGIEQEDLKSVFEAYRQAESSTTRKYGGTGLGLPIVKELVEVMGGRIDATSKAGRGSTFAFTLPLVESDFKPEAAEVIAVAEVPPGVRVLVVDDNYINRLLVIHLLQSKGFDVVEAASGYEALDLLREEDIDAVLMDISMPDMDGFETTRLIRRSDEAFVRNVPVIAMTAHGFQEQVINAREAGMNDYVVKPFKPDNLVKVILSQLGHQETKVTKAAAAAAHSPRLYDLAFIEDYYNKDEKFIRHILTLYVKETPHTVNEIEQALQRGDWAQFKALVHKIKTNVLMLGIKEQDDFFKSSSAVKVEEGDGTIAARFQQFKATVLNALAQIQRDKLS